MGVRGREHAWVGGKNRSSARGWLGGSAILFTPTEQNITRTPPPLPLLASLPSRFSHHLLSPRARAGVQNRLGGTFFALAFLAFTSLTTVDLLMNERAVVTREVRSGYYAPWTYLLSKLALDAGEGGGVDASGVPACPVGVGVGGGG
jgi:hypothetical protein